MSLNDIKKLRYDAEMSCPKWNNNRTSRHFRRSMYIYAERKHTATDEFQERLSEYQKLHENCVGVDEKEFCFNLIDTYPWPYSDPGFVDWEYIDESMLVYDQSHCVVKESASYVAAKIAQIVGDWPQETELTHIGPKDYASFLADAGYDKIVVVPGDTGYYVGVNPDVDACGIVWYEGVVKDKDSVIVSTYKNRVYTIKAYHPEIFTWVKIK